MRIRKALVAVGILTGSALAANLAFAAWNAGGSGSGSAKATNAAGLTTSAVTTTADLYPGATGGLKITINNPNPYPVLVSEVNNDSSASISADKPACTVSGVTFTDQHGQSIAVVAGGSTTTVLAGSVHMSNSSSDGCQGAVFTVPVSLVGASSATS